MVWGLIGGPDAPFSVDQPCLDLLIPFWGSIFIFLMSRMVVAPPVGALAFFGGGENTPQRVGAGRAGLWLGPSGPATAF